MNGQIFLDKINDHFPVIPIFFNRKYPVIIVVLVIVILFCSEHSDYRIHGFKGKERGCLFDFEATYGFGHLIGRITLSGAEVFSENKEALHDRNTLGAYYSGTEGLLWVHGDLKLQRASPLYNLPGVYIVYGSQCS